MKTSFDSWHGHFWSKDKEHTRINNGHVHKIDLKRMLALPEIYRGHTHKLLK